MQNLVSRFVANESGVTAIEYGLIAALVAVVIIGGQTGVPDHLVACDREKVNRAIEVIGLIKLDLEVERLRRLAGPSQPVHVGSIGATEPAEPHHDPRAHGSEA